MVFMAVTIICFEAFGELATCFYFFKVHDIPERFGWTIFVVAAVAYPTSVLLKYTKSQ